MGNFNRDRRSGGGRDFKRKDFGSRDFDRPQIMHKTICSNCGKECEVPFKPNGSKPVFCRECFQKNRSSDSGRSENFSRRPNFEDRGNNQINRPVDQPQYKQQFEALNTKLDKILNLLTIKEEVKEVEISEPNQIPKIEVPIIKKKRVSKK